MRRAGAAALCGAALALVAGPAAADEIVDAELRVRVELPAGFAPREAAAGAAWSHPETGQLAALIRLDGPTRGAWVGDAEFFAGLEAGIQKHTPGYRRLAHKRSRVGGLPAYDLWFRRRGDDGDRVLGVRFLFYRSYGVSLILETPAGAYARGKRACAALLASLRPHRD